MKLLAQLLLVITVILLLTAIWIPEHWIQFALSALVTLVVAAGLLGPKPKS